MDSKATEDAQFLRWKIRVDHICKKLYLIDTHDMGLDDEQLVKLWREDFTPEDVTDYFGTKFNLTLAQDVLICG